MNITGIIMECNPFHEGHAYIINEARRLTGADYILCVMSGDFVQRGEPAVYDKYLRAAQILSAGADLVLEIPLYAACGSAEFFAQGGVSLLESLGVVTDLCFGSESGDTEHILQCAQMLSIVDDALLQEAPVPSFPDPAPGRPGSSPENSVKKNSLKENSVEETFIEETFVDEASVDEASIKEASLLFRGHLQNALKSGLPFPAARSEALAAAAAAISRPALHASAYTGILPSTPNDLLSVEYCRALLSGNSRIRPHAIGRIRVPSATQRRKELLQSRPPRPAKEDIPGTGPHSLQAEMHLSDRRICSPGLPRFPVGPDDFSLELLYALQMQQPVLDSFVDVSEDLADRIRNLLPQYQSYTQFLDLLKTKNVTRTRVSRSLLHILLMMKKDRLAWLQSEGPALYARPLALRRSAAPLLSEIHRRSRIPFLSKLSAAKKHLSPAAFSFLQEEIRAEELYGLTLSALTHSAPAPKAAQRRIQIL